MKKTRLCRDFKRERRIFWFSTTVIEVGVNVPNATVMIIMDADRFGLSQLRSSEAVVGGTSSPMLFSLANPKMVLGKIACVS